jgi:hypothetical protein
LLYSLQETDVVQKKEAVVEYTDKELKRMATAANKQKVSAVLIFIAWLLEWMGRDCVKRIDSLNDLYAAKFC